MEHIDTRVRYTKDILHRTLLGLLKKKRIDLISVTELCREAEINRGTFYLHYSTPNDILKEIEDEFMDRNSSLFFPYLKENYQLNKLESLFAFILQNIETSRIIMGKNGNPKFIERMKDTLRQDILDQWCIEFPDYDRRDLDYVFDYVFEGSMYLITHWVDEDGKTEISADELARRLDRLGHYVHLAIGEF